MPERWTRPRWASVLRLVLALALATYALTFVALLHRPCSAAEITASLPREYLLDPALNT